MSGKRAREGTCSLAKNAGQGNLGRGECWLMLGSRAGGEELLFGQKLCDRGGGGEEEQGANMSDLYLSVALQV